MKITDNKVVVLHYAVSDSEDTLIDSSCLLYTSPSPRD